MGADLPDQPCCKLEDLIDDIGAASLVGRFRGLFENLSGKTCNRRGKLGAAEIYAEAIACIRAQLVQNGGPSDAAARPPDHPDEALFFKTLDNL